MFDQNENLRRKLQEREVVDVNTWKNHEKILEALVRNHPPRLLCTTEHEGIKIDIFFCEGVMRLVNFLINEVKKKDLAGPHNTFTIYFKYRDFGESGLLEYTIDNLRVDIYIDILELKIQVKALSDVTIKDVEAQIAAVDSRGVEDRLWIFFFYQFENHASPDPVCKYLLARISIDLLERDLTETNKLLSNMIHDAKKKAADKLDVDYEILIPMPNLVSDIELKRRIAERDEMLAEKDEMLAEKDEMLAEKDEIITKLKQKLGKGR
ncbi:MAG: hypothetical protein ACTSU9_02495 [Promethearchaeota archaeon]